MSKPLKPTSPKVARLWAQLPKTIRVCAQSCTIELADIPDHKRVWGEYDSDDHAITICSRTATPDRALETVLHEIVHAIYSCWNINNDAKEEDVVKVFAPALICLFRDNPKFLAWFIKALK